MARKGHVTSELAQKGRTTATGRRQHRPQATQAAGNTGSAWQHGCALTRSTKILGTVSLLRDSDEIRKL